MSHYFIEDESLAPDIKTFDYYFADLRFTFTSNSGIFSPGHVDPASSLLIQALPPLQGSLLDMGCGYGPIGIVLAKAYGLALTLADVNGRALECARLNCDANGVTARVLQSNCFQGIGGVFDQIAINPPIHAGKAVVYAMYQGSHAHLAPGGRLYVVIQQKHGAPSTVKKLVEIFGNCDTLYKKKGTWVLACTR